MTSNEFKFYLRDRLQLAALGIATPEEIEWLLDNNVPPQEVDNILNTWDDYKAYINPYIRMNFSEASRIAMTVISHRDSESDPVMIGSMFDVIQVNPGSPLYRFSVRGWWNK